MKILKPITMNCSPTICVALLLLSLSAGMWLLYKSQKENLGTFFKVVAWFVIVVSFCSMICCGLRCVMHGCMRGNECEKMERCEMGAGECTMGMHGGMSKRIMICEDDDKCEMGGGKCCGMCKEGKGECEEGEGEKCKEGKMDCCKKGEKKCEMKKDSVVIKK